MMSFAKRSSRSGRQGLAAAGLLLAATLLSGASQSPSGDAPTVRLAERTLALLARGDSTSLAALHHYPPSFSSDERAKDAAGVAGAIEFLLESFGKPERVPPNQTPVEFYVVGAGGGSIPYWASISPFSEETVTYSVRFSKLGPGFIQLSIVRVAGGPAELRIIDFGLPKATPDSKSTMASLMVGVVGRMGLPVTDAVRKSIAEQLQPVIAPPASLE